MKKKLRARLFVALMATALIAQPVLAQTTSDIIVETVETAVHTHEESYPATGALGQSMSELMVNTYGVPNMQYAVMVDGEITVSGAYRNSSLPTDSETFNEDTLYGIGSVSKMYTATAIMQLVEMGKVDLDAPVTTYIPEFEMADERYADITVRMLINHSSGLMGSTFEDTFLYEDKDTYAQDTLLENLKTQRLKADPGAFSVYCNDGFMLAELVVERVSGMSFTEFITENIAAPLGLEHTVTPENIEGWDNVATNYGLDMTTQMPMQMPVEVANVIGTGGIYSTAEELCQFGQIFTESSDVLKADTIEAMGTNEAEKGMWIEGKNSSVDFGLGWDSVNLYPFNEYGITAWMKGGDTLNYHTSLIVLPEYNMSVAVASSGGSSVYNQMIATELALSALYEQGDIEAIKPHKTFTAPVAVAIPEEYKQYEGFYVAAGQMAEVSMDEANMLNVGIVGAEHLPPQQYAHTGDGKFVSLDGSTVISVVEEENGETYLYAEGYMTLPGISQGASSYYFLQKVEASTLSDEELAAWSARHGKVYFGINEKYTSAVHQVGMQLVGIMLNEKTPGYMVGYEITSVDEAQSVGQIPGMNGRDMSDIKFYQHEGVEYVTLGTVLAIGIEGVETIAVGNGTCTIGESGYTRWYHVGDAAGKTMTVTLPETGGFAVYDANGMCVNHTVVTGNSTVVLPQGGYVAFMGDAGTVFEITMQ